MFMWKSGSSCWIGTVRVGVGINVVIVGLKRRSYGGLRDGSRMIGWIRELGSKVGRFDNVSDVRDELEDLQQRKEVFEFFVMNFIIPWADIDSIVYPMSRGGRGIPGWIIKEDWSLSMRMTSPISEVILVRSLAKCPGGIYMQSFLVNIFLIIRFWSTLSMMLWA